jgi:cytochrome oxidase Cu insertion factor (SCO1/SenC/PrrC family)
VTRGLATLAIALLLALDVALPYTPLGRRGSERAVCAHVAAAASWVGRALPPLAFEDAAGRTVRLGDLLGRPILLVFERSVDW